MLLQALLILWCTISEACHFAAMCDFPQMFFQYDCLLSNPLAVVKLSIIYQAKHKGAHNAESAIYRFKKIKQNKTQQKNSNFWQRGIPPFSTFSSVLASLHCCMPTEEVMQCHSRTKVYYLIKETTEKTQRTSVRK